VTAVELDSAGFVSHMLDYGRAIPAGHRRIVAIAGPPASGKSTLAAVLADRLNEAEPGLCALLPMDGFHFDDEVLIPRGWLSRKGAPYTFDVDGYATALRRLRRNEEESIAVPRFDRSIEIARAGAIIIERDVRLVITEGNYLLLDVAPWSTLRPSFDQAVLLVTEMATLEARNHQRWVDIEMDEGSIRAKLESNDMPNARLVVDGSAEPDWIVRT
jgi:pantothenate kinase